MASASWNILAGDACWWTRSYQEAWAREERRIHEPGIQGPVDLLTCFRDVVRRLITRRGKESLMRWAAFIHHGYWMFPPRELEGFWDLK